MSLAYRSDWAQRKLLWHQTQVILARISDSFPQKRQSDSPVVESFLRVWSTCRYDETVEAWPESMEEVCDTISECVYGMSPVSSTTTLYDCSIPKVGEHSLRAYQRVLIPSRRVVPDFMNFVTAEETSRRWELRVLRSKNHQWWRINTASERLATRVWFWCIGGSGSGSLNISLRMQDLPRGKLLEYANPSRTFAQ